jgi:hypothetical protein
MRDREGRSQESRGAKRTTLDPTTVREGLAHYRASNEAELVDRVRSAGKKMPEDKWQEYRALFSFSQLIKPEHSLE